MDDFLAAQDRLAFSVLAFLAMLLLIGWQIARAIARRRSKDAIDWRAEDSEKRAATDDP